MTKITYKVAISAGSALAMMIATVGLPKVRDMAGTKAVDQIADDQRRVEQYKRDSRKRLRAAVRELVTEGQTQIVLGHIQPRWVRREVEAMMDGGLEVTPEIIALLKKRGPR